MNDIKPVTLMTLIAIAFFICNGMVIGWLLHGIWDDLYPGGGCPKCEISNIHIERGVVHEPESVHVDYVIDHEGGK